VNGWVEVLQGAEGNALCWRWLSCQRSKRLLCGPGAPSCRFRCCSFLRRRSRDLAKSVGIAPEKRRRGIKDDV
jgi:hypothetical protein